MLISGELGEFQIEGLHTESLFLLNSQCSCFRDIIRIQLLQFFKNSLKYVLSERKEVVHYENWADAAIICGVCTLQIRSRSVTDSGRHCQVDRNSRISSSWRLYHFRDRTSYLWLWSLRLLSDRFCFG